jgi:hypothetical protein
MDAVATPRLQFADVLPKRRDLYYGGKWQKPAGGYGETINPATGEGLGACAAANAEDVDAAVHAAHQAFRRWSAMKPLDRAGVLKAVAAVLREHAGELAMIDAANCGNPVKEMTNDVVNGARAIDFFAGLVSEIKGHTVPMGDGVVNITVREPYGVCARIVAYNHPLMFAAAKFAAPLAAGNTVIIKPPPQAPLSAYRMMELIDGILPPGVLNILTGDRECGEALTEHPLIPVAHWRQLNTCFLVLIPNRSVPPHFGHAPMRSLPLPASLIPRRAISSSIGTARARLMSSSKDSRRFMRPSRVGRFRKPRLVVDAPDACAWSSPASQIANCGRGLADKRFGRG